MDGYARFAGPGKWRSLLIIAQAMDQWMPDIMIDAEKTISEGNRRGIMEGTQGDGSQMPATKYRGSMAAATKTRKGNDYGRTTGKYKGPALVVNGKRGKATKRNGNLTTAEYRKLTGPAMAPRGDESRSIANLFTRHFKQGGTWIAQGAWINVVSAKGRPFLRYHFRGNGTLPRRDLRGVRPRDLAAFKRRSVAILKRKLRGG